MSENHDQSKAWRPDYWRTFAEIAARDDDCPLYALLARGVAEDPALQALAALAKPGQPPANLLFAAAHALLLAGDDHPLRAWYPHLAAAPAPAIDAAAWTTFVDFAQSRRAALAELIAARVTNTNEVGRCAYLRCAFAALAARTGSPLSLIELGPSAGLNLNWDRYAYRYILDNNEILEGGPSSPLVLQAHARGAPPPIPAVPPAMARRIGLELNPVDLASEADRRWLLALVWPGRPERIERLGAALAIAAHHPPPIRAGDALANLAEELAAAPTGAARVVTHTLVTYQWTASMRARLEQILLEASRDRPVWRVFHDLLDHEHGADAMPLRLRIYRDATVREETLALAHHHGAWLAWSG